MKIFDDLASVLFEVIVSHGSLKFEKALERLELLLKESKTPYFLSSPIYSMVDLYGFPHCSRVFYLKGSALNSVYEDLKIE
jgi:hypothetical protein